MSRQARNVMLLVAVLTGCSVQDVNLAQQQLTSSDPGQQSAGLETLESMSGRGYVDATVALAKRYDDTGDIAALRQVKARMARAALSGPQEELSYLGWLLDASARIPEWVPEVDRRLLQRQQARGDVFDLLTRLYQREPSLDTHQLVAVFQLLDLRQAIPASRWLRGQIAIDGLFKVATESSLQQACATVMEQGRYVDCLQTRLFWLRAGRPQAVKDVKTWVEQVHQGLDAHTISVADLGGLMDDAVVARPGAAQKNIALALGALAPDEPAIALRRYALIVSSEGTEEETDKMEAHLRRLNQEGYLRAGTLLGRLYLDSPRRVPDMQKARRYLSAATQDPQGAYWLGSQLLSGQLGDASADKVSQGCALLVQSGRQGYRRADIYLANLFARGQGVVRNPVYASVFARLVAGRHANIPAMSRLLDDLHLSVAEQAQADALLKREQAWRDKLSVETRPAQGNADPVLVGRVDPQSEDQG